MYGRLHQEYPSELELTKPQGRMLPVLSPLPLIQQASPFSDSDWLFEVKYDGWRSLAYIEDGKCRLVSRNGNTFQRFRQVSKALCDLRCEAILDGEIACVDDTGLPQFIDLMIGSAPVRFFAFDILVLDGEDLRDQPCVERKKMLQELVNGDIQRLHYVEHIAELGEQLFDQICERDMEGIVAKPKDSPYREIRGKTPWRKIKNPDYSQAEGRGELFQQDR